MFLADLARLIVGLLGAALSVLAFLALTIFIVWIVTIL
jgi:hypothetical protein